MLSPQDPGTSSRAHRRPDRPPRLPARAGRRRLATVLAAAAVTAGVTVAAPGPAQAAPVADRPSSGTATSGPPAGRPAAGPAPAVAASGASEAAAATVGPALPGGAFGTPAAVKYCHNCADDLVVVRAETGRLYWALGGFFNTVDVESFAYRGWREIPGGGITPYAPSVTRMGDFIYVAVVGSGGNGMFLQRHNWKTGAWDAGWGQVPGGGVFTAGPTVAGYAEQLLYFFAPGLDRRIFQSYWGPGVGWAGSWSVTGDFRTSVAVAATEYRAVVRAFARADDGRIYQRAFSFLGNDPGWTEVPGGGRTNHSPAVGANAPRAGFNDPERMVLLVRGTGDGVFYQKMEGTSWNPGWKALPQAGSTPYGPGVFGFGLEGFRAFVVGGDRGVYTQYLNYNWQNPSTLQLSGNLNPNPGWILIPRSRPAPTTPTPPQPPTQTRDLVFTGPPVFNPSTEKVTVTFRNAGNTATGGFRVSFQMPGMNEMVRTFTSAAAGQTFTVEFDLSFLNAGIYNYNIALDSGYAVPETDENNSWNGYFEIAPE